MEKTRLSTQLMALQATKSSAVDPTEELERDLEVATEVNLSEIALHEKIARTSCHFVSHSIAR